MFLGRFWLSEVLTRRLIMLKTILISGAIVVSLLLPSFVLSQERETREYKVKQGDTLWDISSKELNDPFLWPKIWKENPEISNPDRLLPGQSIRIPLYVIQKEKEEESAAKPVIKTETIKPKVEAVAKGPEPVKLLPLVNRNLLLASGYIANSVDSVGKVDGSPTGRILFGNDDVIYVKTSAPVLTGDKFYIVRAEEHVIHPVTGKDIGNIVVIKGIAEITKFEYGETLAKIIQMFDDIHTGDLLSTYYELNPPLTTKSHRKPDINGVILAAKGLRILNTNYDVVYIDKGEKDGVEIGDMLQAIDVGAHKVPNGIIQIINYKDTTATAIVINNKGPVLPGNLITKME
jgi:hypothetical protein